MSLFRKTVPGARCKWVSVQFTGCNPRNRSVCKRRDKMAAKCHRLLLSHVRHRAVPPQLPRGDGVFACHIAYCQMLASKLLFFRSLPLRCVFSTNCLHCLRSLSPLGNDTFHQSAGSFWHRAQWIPVQYLLVSTNKKDSVQRSRQEQWRAKSHSPNRTGGRLPEQPIASINSNQALLTWVMTTFVRVGQKLRPPVQCTANLKGWMFHHEFYLLSPSESMHKACNLT